MATKGKDDVSAPIRFLIVFLALAMAFGAAGGIGDGGGNGRPGGSRARTVEGRTVYLRCGTEEGDPGGYRHIRSRHARDTDWRKVVECIGRTVTRGEYGQAFRGKPGRVKRDFYTWGYEPGKVAEVVVHIQTGNIMTAYLDRGSWTSCAGR